MMGICIQLRLQLRTIMSWWDDGQWEGSICIWPSIRKDERYGRRCNCWIVELGIWTQTKSAWDLQSQMTRKVLKIIPFKSAVCLDCSALHISKRRLQMPQQSLDRHRLYMWSESQNDFTLTIDDQIFHYLNPDFLLVGFNYCQMSTLKANSKHHKSFASWYQSSRNI